MKKRYSMLIGIFILAILLEVLPFGAVLNFANPEGEPFRRTYSYFDLTPFGYANFGPFCTALLTCVLLTLSAIGAFLKGRAIQKAITLIGIAAALASLSPLLYGVRYFTWIGLIISCLLISATLLSRIPST